MKKLEDLISQSIAIKIFDHEEYKKLIKQTIQRANDATINFQVCVILFKVRLRFIYLLHSDRNCFEHSKYDPSDRKGKIISPLFDS